jgi:hypothetical protein
MEAADPAMPRLAPLYHFHFAGGAHAIRLGLTISQAQGTLLQKGICAFALHAHAIEPSTVVRTPSPEAVFDGLRRRPIDLESGSLNWTPISAVAGPIVWKRHLASGRPIVIALQPNAAYRALSSRDPILANNSFPYEPIGHAAAVIGYQDADRVFVVQDSGGIDSALNGQWFLPYELGTSPFITLAYSIGREGQ